MRKTLVIARREYLAAVKTKTFLIGLVLMPVLMGGSIVVQLLLKDFRDLKEKSLAVIDRSPGGKVAIAIQQALDAPAAAPREGQPRYHAEVINVPGGDEALTQEREALRQMLRQGDKLNGRELVGFLVVGKDVLHPGPASASGETDSPNAVVFGTNRLSGLELRSFLERVINQAVRSERSRGLSPERRQEIQEITRPVQLEQQVHPDFIVPVVLMLLMFLVLMMVANPLMQGVVEEKMQRIAEVLLGSVTPFELMLGKLLGMAAVSLTIVTVYLLGGIWAAVHYGFGSLLPPVSLLVWFFAFQTLAALMYGSLFTAIGAACTDMKETQNLLLPVMLLCCVPLFVMTLVMREPNGPVVTGLSFFPFATPMLMIGRMAVPPGVEWWQPVAGMVVVLASTLACVWAAGRIFRVGLLMQGKAPHLGELVHWVLKG
jgi:ABC-2 type transport system permease protein